MELCKSTNQEITLWYGHEHFDEGAESVVQSRISVKTEDSKVDVPATQSCLLGNKCVRRE